MYRLDLAVAEYIHRSDDFFDRHMFIQKSTRKLLTKIDIFLDDPISIQKLTRIADAQRPSSSEDGAVCANGSIKFDCAFSRGRPFYSLRVKKSIELQSTSIGSIIFGWNYNVARPMKHEFGRLVQTQPIKSNESQSQGHLEEILLHSKWTSSVGLMVTNLNQFSN